jgi:hypothetical protein
MTLGRPANCLFDVPAKSDSSTCNIWNIILLMMFQILHVAATTGEQAAEDKRGWVMDNGRQTHQPTINRSGVTKG